MQYRVETHCHTSEVSGCGMVTARDMVAAHAEAGYRMMIITDHWPIPRRPVRTAAEVDRQFIGYYNAREAGRALGVHVLPGVELRFPDTNEDYLLMGLRDDQLRMLLEDAPSDLEAFSAFSRAQGWLLYQAHPFRMNLRLAPLSYLDGIEFYNGNMRHDSRNELAFEVVRRSGLLGIAGSDAHQLCDVGRSGVWAPSAEMSAGEWVKWLKAVQVTPM